MGLLARAVAMDLWFVAWGLVVAGLVVGGVPDLLIIALLLLFLYLAVLGAAAIGHGKPPRVSDLLDYNGLVWRGGGLLQRHYHTVFTDAGPINSYWLTVAYWLGEGTEAQRMAPAVGIPASERAGAAAWMLWLGVMGGGVVFAAVGVPLTFVVGDGLAFTVAAVPALLVPCLAVAANARAVEREYAEMLELLDR